MYLHMIMSTTAYHLYASLPTPNQWFLRAYTTSAHNVRECRNPMHCMHLLLSYNYNYASDVCVWGGGGGEGAPDKDFRLVMRWAEQGLVMWAWQGMVRWAGHGEVGRAW